jgi:hypothetical protein
MGLVHRAPGPSFAVRLAARRTAKGMVHRALEPFFAARRHVTHGKGHGPPCAWTIFCRASHHVMHGKEYHRSRASSAAHGKESVTPSPRGRPSTPFLCRASRIAHDEELCCALPFPKAHGKGLCGQKCVVRPLPCAWA